jgi:hypothetical protein
MQALQNPDHNAEHADAWCCGAILYMLLGGAFPFLTTAEAERGPMRQLHYLVQRITSSRFLDLARSVSISGLHLLGYTSMTTALTRRQHRRPLNHTQHLLCIASASAEAARHHPTPACMYIELSLCR